MCGLSWTTTTSHLSKQQSTPIKKLRATLLLCYESSNAMIFLHFKSNKEQSVDAEMQPESNKIELILYRY
jgi:hypothetical protein